MPALRLLREIRELGYQGSRTLLVQYIAQGRADEGRPHLSTPPRGPDPLTRPDALTPASGRPSPDSPPPAPR